MGHDVLVDRDPPGTVELHRGSLRLTVAAGTDVGRRYPANFDVMHVEAQCGLFAVADGMGSGTGSAVAGRTTVDAFSAAIGAATAANGPLGPATLRAAVADVQRLVGAAGAKLGELTGCTLTALVADSDADAWVVQLGDSRAYRMRDDQLELLTVDHTVAWLGAVYGWYPADSPQAAAARYHLTRYVGHPNRPEADLLNVTLRPGDTYLLCTDGVAEQVPYQRLAALLRPRVAPADVVAAVLSDARAAGGQDNATLIVIRID